MPPPISVMAARVHRIVGVIGGMGPEATVDLMRRVIAKTPAHGDADHVHLIVESNPKIPSRIAHLIEGTGEDPTPELVRIAQNLERAGADALAMPCNTAHVYAQAIARSVSTPLLDMVEMTADAIRQRPGWRRTMLFASTAVLSTRLFHKALGVRGIEVLVPSRQEDLMALIMGVKRGEIGSAAQDSLAQLAKDAGNQADVVLIACSELSVIADRITVPVVDSLDVLAQAIVDFAVT
jgi:aspartate racemase